MDEVPSDGPVVIALLVALQAGDIRLPTEQNGEPAL